MSLLLYINGKLADLETGQTIARTLQVNDLNSLDTRQAGYTNKFKLPKTANNIRIMQFLTLPGNNAVIPYQKNECSLYSDTGECFVYNGRAVITDGGDGYDVVVYDGIINLYKAIENQSLADVGLEELTHGKDVATVVSTWQTQRPFLYILADYNGDTGPTNTTENNPAPWANIDYLVPSVNVAWLWQKVFAKYQAGYTGAVFNTAKFKNLYMTFPKGLRIAGENDHLVFDTDDYRFVSINANGNNAASNIYFAKFNSIDVNELPQTDSNIHLTIPDTATYRLEIKGTLYGHGVQGDNQPQNAFIKIGRNCIGMGTSQANQPQNNDAYFFGGNSQSGSVSDNLPFGEEFELISPPVQLQAGENICIIIKRSTNYPGSYTSYTLGSTDTRNVLDVKLHRIDPNVIDFSKAFVDFPVKDFLNEVVHRFGLTMYKDKYADNYTFLTLQEQLQNAERADWSSKFSKKLSEDYTYGNYARQNWFRYNYNDKEATHNDGFIEVDNINLADSRDVIKSRIYSPERLKSIYLDKETSIYKLWEKEIVENPAEGAAPVKYTPLDKRYYFLQADPVTQNTLIKSVMLGQQQQVSLCYRESYLKLGFADVIHDYYKPMERILNTCLVVTAELYLKETDIANFDFKKLYYIQQLSNYFIMNKISNYIPGKPVKCELVRVHYHSEQEKQITITSYQRSGSDLAIWFTANYPTGTKKLQIHFEEADWIHVQNVTTSPVVYRIGIPDTVHYRIHDITNNVYSDFITVTT